MGPPPGDGSMSARKPAPAESPRELADQHDLRIHRAKQLARQVSYKGLNCFIAGFCWHKGDAEMTVYIEGLAEPVAPTEITILEQPQ
jgi:hypothetical protein